MKIFLLLLVLIFLVVPVNAVEWHDDSRLKRVQLNVNNASVALTDYQLMKTITYDSDMQPDFDDLLFYNESGGNVSYWIESKTDSSTADVWLNIPSISTTEGMEIWMYYGNSSVSSASNGDAVFPKLFKDFENDDLNDWSNQGVTLETQSSVKYSGANAFRYYHNGAISYGYVGLQYDAVLTTSDIVEFRYMVSSNTNTGAQIVPVASAYNSNDRIDTMFDGTVLKIYDGSWTNIETGLSEDVWYQMSTVVDRASDRCDIWSNVPTADSPTLDNTGIRGTLSATENWFHLSKGASGSCIVEIFIDNLCIRKYTAIEPTWGTDGEEESYEAPPTLNGTYLYPNSTYSIGYYGSLTSELVYETGINMSDLYTSNLLSSANMEYLSIDDTNYIPSIDKDAAHDGYMYGNFSLSCVESINFITVKTVHNRVHTNPVILGLFNVSTQKWHAVNNSSVETVDVELTYNITGTDIAKYTTLENKVLNLSVSLNTNGDGNYDVFVDFVEVYVDYEEVPCVTLEYVYNLTISNQNNISILQNDVDDLENNVNNLYLFVLLCTVFLVATLRKGKDEQ